MQIEIDPAYFGNDNAQKGALINIQLTGDFSDVLMLPEVAGKLTIKTTQGNAEVQIVNEFRSVITTEIDDYYASHEIGLFDR